MSKVILIGGLFIISFSVSMGVKEEISEADELKIKFALYQSMSEDRFNHEVRKCNENEIKRERERRKDPSYVTLRDIYLSTLRQEIEKLEKKSSH
jgi:hypothetical protein